MRVLVACEESGRVRDAFLAAGHDAMSCDLHPTAVPGPHYQGDVRDVLTDGWDLMVAHPDCRYLTRSGQHWLNRPDDHNPEGLKGAPRWDAVHDAARFFTELRNAPIPRIAVENPRPGSHAAALIGWPDQVIHPWQFGHPESKATGLWLTNLPPLVPTDVLPKRGPNGEDNRRGVVYGMGPRPDRRKLRARTHHGIAAAMAQQWGGVA